MTGRWGLMCLGPHRWFDLSVSRSDGGTNHWASVVTSDGTPMYVWIGDSSEVNAKFIPAEEPPLNFYHEEVEEQVAWVTSW